MAAGEERGYDAFISYSHRLDAAITARLQAELQRFAKPWYRVRALHVFRDQTSLAASPHLWTTIEEALAALEANPPHTPAAPPLPRFIRPRLSPERAPEPAG